MARHTRWHYQDQRGSRDSNATDGELYSQLSRLVGLLQQNTPHTEKSYTLVWLLHLVADAHQPLHNGFKEDAGGNDVPVLVFGERSNRSTNLHAFWDSLPNQRRLKGAALFHTAEAIMAKHPPNRASLTATIVDWQKQNLAVALRFAYPEPIHHDTNPPIVLQSAFIERAEQVAESQIALAGYRLGLLINNIFSSPKRTPFHVERRP